MSSLPLFVIIIIIITKKTTGGNSNNERVDAHNIFTQYTQDQRQTLKLLDRDCTHS